MSRIRLALFEDTRRAERARQRLLAAGVPAEIEREPGVAKLWFVNRRRAGTRLEVPTKNLERSRRLLLEGSHGELSGAIRCPNCGSLRIDFPQFTQKSLLTNVMMGLAAGLKSVDKEYYCEDCHHMWPRRRRQHHRRQAHPAPDYFLER